MNCFAVAPDTTEPLTWGRRLKTMLGVARGLNHLHVSKFIHFNLRSWNVLVAEVPTLSYMYLMVVSLLCHQIINHFYSFLFQDFDAKLGGLSLAKYCHEGEESLGTARHCGPMAYNDPEYMKTGMLL